MTVSHTAQVRQFDANPQRGESLFRSLAHPPALALAAEERAQLATEARYTGTPATTVVHPFHRDDFRDRNDSATVLHGTPPLYLGAPHQRDAYRDRFDSASVQRPGGGTGEEETLRQSLDGWSRAQLNAYATKVGVSNPAGLSNKAAVIDAIVGRLFPAEGGGTPPAPALTSTGATVTATETGWTVTVGEGAYALSYDGGTTASIATNAASSAVKTALDALSKGTWTVTGSAGGPYAVTRSA